MTNAESVLRVTVKSMTDEAPGIRSFELVAQDGGALPAFTAGAHIDVMIPGGPTRQYSLCNNPLERHRYLIAVLRNPAGRGGSVAMHEQVSVGDVIDISAPRNQFALAEESSKSLLLAGGIGVTPLLAMAEHLHSMGADFEMHYCARSKERAAFHDRIVAAPYAGKVQLHFDNGAPGQIFNAAAQLQAPQTGTHLYVCGPAGFMDAVLGSARALGWPGSQVHKEHFGASPVLGDAAAFEVFAARSGRLISVSHDRTVVQALAEAGVHVPVSCEQGVCGTCITRVLDGTPDHRDLYLTPDEQAANDRFTPCCSRSLSQRLVLDL
jgi:vanillate O-demethylase ferredoxin subunit